MVWIQLLFFIISIILSLLFFIYGFNHYYLLNASRKYKAPDPPDFPGKRPAVAIHLPIYDEKYVLSRLVAACTQMVLAYGIEIVRIMILDDSDDDTVQEVDRLVWEYQQKGFRIEVLRRSNRNGYKAGALQAALAETKEDYIAIFDADFIPPEDFLLRSMPYFAGDEHLAIVQGRWSFVNKESSLLTRAISHIIDVHFLIEQTGRYAAGIFQNFNGSAGVLRRQAIQEAGGWQSDTLAEDLDISYRMQVCGYHVLYLRDLICPGEIPPTIPSFKLQQGRWANGTLKTAMKILPSLLKNRNIGLKQRLQAFIHLTGYMIQPFMVISFVLGCFSAVWGINQYQSLQAARLAPSLENLSGFGPVSIILWQNLVWLIMAPFIILCTLAPWISLLTTLKVQKLPLIKNLTSMLLLLLLCFGISLSILRGAMRAFFTRRAWEWTRTPKNADMPNKHETKQSKYQLPVDLLWVWELVFVLLGLWAIGDSIRTATFSGLLILIPFTLSYGFVFLFSILQNRKVKA
jgi:cellulose synthase/poly-beta-1,6-N-acetylglucosamine synthase-like glycosyltransferase